MKTTLLSVAVAAALSVAVIVPAAAQSAAGDAGSESVKVSAARYHIEPQEFQDYLYSYQLDNGETVKFTRRVGRFYTEVKGNARVEIYAAGPGEFVTDSGARIRFADDGNTLTITNYERLPMAARLPASTLMVARR